MCYHLGIAFENDGGAIIVETYSRAAINRSYFEGNEATDTRGAIFVKIRSYITLSKSVFKLNKAGKRGGSVMVHQSVATIEYCTFMKDSTNLGQGYGGAIFINNVANVTVLGSSFDNCMAYRGGSIAMESESVLSMEDSHITHSFAVKSGGAIFALRKSFINGNNLTVSNGKSVKGAGIFTNGFNVLDLRNYDFLRNTVNKSGGAIYCVQSQVTMEKGNLLDNFAELNGDGIFSDTCQVTIDYSRIVNNTGLIEGGGMYSTASVIEIHNTEGINNTAEKTGSFGVITVNSKFESNYLHLSEDGGNYIIISNSSKADLKHTYLSSLRGYCPIVSTFGSDITVDYIYLTDQNDKKHIDSENRKTIVCTDGTSSAQGTTKGILTTSFTRTVVSAFKYVYFC